MRRFLFRIGPVLVLTGTALAPAFWFLDGLPTKGVDSFFSLNPSTRLTSSLSAWESRSSVGSPVADLITAGLNAVQASLDRLGLPLHVIQALVLTLLAASAVAGMYRFLTELLADGTRPSHRRWIASICAALWIVNPFSLSYVWRNQLLMEFTWATLPWLLWILTVAMRGKRSRIRASALTLIVTILGSAGYPHVYLPATLLLLAVVGFGLLLGSPNKRRSLATLAIFMSTFLAGLSWWLAPSIQDIAHLVNASEIEASSDAQFQYASRFSSIPNVISLSAQPVLHASVGEVRYTSWGPRVTSFPGSFLRFLLPGLAFVGATLGFARFRAHRHLIALTVVAAFAAVLVSKGLQQPFPALNIGLLKLPLGEAFRHPVDKLALLLVPALLILAAYGLASLPSKRLSTAGLGATLAISVVWLGLPWWTASVIPRGGGLLPSAKVEVPASYGAVGRAMNAWPSGGKTMVVPYSLDGGSAFRWKVGVQPNLDPLIQDWSPDRSTIARPVGLPDADRVGATLLSALREEDPRIFALARLWGVDGWLVHKDWAASYMKPSITPQDANRFLVASESPSSATQRQPIMRLDQRVRIPAEAGSFSLEVFTESPPRSEDVLLKLGDVRLQLNREGFFALRNMRTGEWSPAPLSRLNAWHTVSLRYSQGRLWLTVDLVPSSDIAQDRKPDALVINQACSDCGTTLLTKPAFDQVVERDPQGEEPLEPRLAMDTRELTLWRQSALPLMYAAGSVEHLNDLSSEALLAAAARTERAPYPVLIGPSPPLPLADARAIENGASLTWHRPNPSLLEGSLHVQGSTILVFSQTFDSHWKLWINGEPTPPRNHIKVNGFANGWLVGGNGTISWQLRYQPQAANNYGQMFAAILLGIALFMLALSLLAAGRRHRRPVKGREQTGSRE